MSPLVAVDCFCVIPQRPHVPVINLFRCALAGMKPQEWHGSLNNFLAESESLSMLGIHLDPGLSPVT